MSHHVYPSYFLFFNPFIIIDLPASYSLKGENNKRQRSTHNGSLEFSSQLHVKAVAPLYTLFFSVLLPAFILIPSLWQNHDLTVTKKCLTWFLLSLLFFNHVFLHILRLVHRSSPSNFVPCFLPKGKHKFRWLTAKNWRERIFEWLGQGWHSELQFSYFNSIPNK